MPRFSVIVPAYNAQHTLAETLDAVGAQEYQDWECVIVDDGSTDGTRAIAQSFADADSRFRVISQSNMGAAGAYNTGVQASTGELVVICSADDLLLPRHMTALSRHIDAHPSFEIYSTNGYYLLPEGTRRQVYRDGEIARSLRLSNVIRNCFFGVGAAYRRSVFEEVNGYRMGVYGEDYDFWLRAMATGARHSYVPTPLAVHRVSDSQKSADLTRVFRSDIEILRNLEETTPLSRRDARAIEQTVLAREMAIVERGMKEHSDSFPKVLVVPSWYPSRVHPTHGIFIAQQVSALQSVADVAVLYVSAVNGPAGASVTLEDGAPVGRAWVRTPPVSRTIPGRIRAVVTNLYNQFWNYPRRGGEVFELLRRSWGEPDVIHVQALWPAALIARRLSKRYGIPYVITEHSEEYSAASNRRLVKYPLFVRLALRPLARGASRNIAVSRFLADRLVELGLAVEPVVVPNVVPVFAAAPVVTAEPRVIAHVSVMGPAKNLPGPIDAVNVLRKRRNDFTVRLVGDGECRVETEERVRSLGLTDIVEFTGMRSADEVFAILSESACTVISSTHETFSVSAAESLMVGRPVVSTRCGGPEEFITPEVGRLVSAGDSDALAEGLNWMLDHHMEFDPNELHDYAVSRFSPDVIADRLFSTYQEVLDG